MLDWFFWLGPAEQSQVPALALFVLLAAAIVTARQYNHLDIGVESFGFLWSRFCYRWLLYLLVVLLFDWFVARKLLFLTSLLDELHEADAAVFFLSQLLIVFQRR